MVEPRTHNQVSPDSNPLCYRFEDWAFSFSPLTPLSLSCINEYLAIDSGGNVSDLVLARNCCLARMFPGEAALVSEWTGLSGRAKCVKRFERSNGLDTALYKNYLLSKRSQRAANPTVINGLIGQLDSRLKCLEESTTPTTFNCLSAPRSPLRAYKGAPMPVVASHEPCRSYAIRFSQSKCLKQTK